MQNYTDDDLIKGCINGNAHIEHALYKTYASKLFAVALRYTHIEADAEDVLQNAFVDIYKNIGKFKYQGSFEGWLRKIVARTAINCFKNRLHFVNENELESVVDFNSNDAFSQLSYNDIIKLIACLPDGYRIIFNLYVVEGYQHAEIADLLNIKEATSRSQLTKARAYLKSLMQQELKRLAKHI